MMKNSTLVVSLLLLSIAAVVNAPAQRAPKFSDWAPVVHLPPPINSEFDDQAAILSKDEKTLYFTSNRTGSVGGSEDIWVSTRKNKNSQWRTPVNLGPTINTPAMERVRSITADGRVLLFQSDRAGGLGLTDIWAVTRKHTNDDSDWGEPMNLGANINTASTELAANYLFADAGRVNKLFFSSTKPGGFGGPDIYESTIGIFGFEQPVNVVELNTPSIETCFWVRDDGLEILFSSNRPNLTLDINEHNIWVSTRDSVYQSWSVPVMLGPAVNVPGYQDVNPSLSFDGRTMMMASRRPGGIGPGSFDIYMTTRRPIGTD
ncbi:MAG: hypothetical protein ACR2IH_14275, partial [Pyrinomonadaceae bacterium]